MGTEEAPPGPGTETLHYRVPDGQDPAVLIAALSHAGYTSALDEAHGDAYVAVDCPAGRDRERARVRAVIGDADGTSLEGPEFTPDAITFDDEN
jgi:hypothetical protein